MHLAINSSPAESCHDNILRHVQKTRDYQENPPRYKRWVKVKYVIKRLKGDGWYQVRVKGSHRQFHHPSKPGTVTVAGKLSVNVPPGTLRSILKQAGLK
jgi:predicted RNA binding protein YcfA (HicA-like mRNA interferase family)